MLQDDKIQRHRYKKKNQPKARTKTKKKAAEQKKVEKEMYDPRSQLHQGKYMTRLPRAQF